MIPTSLPQNAGKALDLLDILKNFGKGGVARPGEVGGDPLPKKTIRYNVLQAPTNGKAAPMVNRLNGYLGGATGTWQGPVWTGRKRRTMNPANIKALRRAARRLESFVKIAKRFIRIEKQVKIKKARCRR
jgi:hypothetical protein